MSSDPWGRVDETGTVYVRTADGEQVVGSWQAGSPEEALAYFERKYEGLVVEIGLLEKRVKTTDLSAKDAQAAIDHIREQVDAHHVVGDLDALRVRLDKLVELVEARREERKAQRAKQSDEARHAKEALVAEAEELSQSEQWRAAGERLRALVDTWKGLPRLDRKSDDELWHRFSHARSAFSKRRKQHFAQLDAQREEARKTKERLVSEAEALSNSTDWGVTAARYRELMSEWKAAGRAQREHEDDLWNRFRGAQDVFFAARSSVFAERDAEQSENLKLKEELAEEAEKLLPITDLKAARAASRRSLSMSIVTVDSVMQSRTVISIGLRPRPSERTTMSRSVMMPISSPASTTGRTPKSPSRISQAASSMVASGLMACTSVFITCLILCMTMSSNEQFRIFPQAYAGYPVQMRVSM